MNVTVRLNNARQLARDSCSCSSSPRVAWSTCIPSMELLLKETARVSHRKVKAQSLLAHEVGHSIVPQHTRSESKGSTGCVDGCCYLSKPIGSQEVASRNQCESQLDGEEYAEVNDVQWSRSDQEEEVEDGPHWFRMLAQSLALSKKIEEPTQDEEAKCIVVFCRTSTAICLSHPEEWRDDDPKSEIEQPESAEYSVGVGVAEDNFPLSGDHHTNSCYAKEISNESVRD